jgi:hypothetical protein
MRVKREKVDMLENPDSIPGENRVFVSACKPLIG